MLLLENKNKNPYIRFLENKTLINTQKNNYFDNRHSEVEGTTDGKGLIICIHYCS